MASVINSHFPVSIGYVTNVLEKDEHKFIFEYFMNKANVEPKGGKLWQADLYNTHDTWHPHKDTNCDILNNKILDRVRYWALNLGSNYNYKIDSSWINVYIKKDYQEWHDHENSVISAVYYAANPGSSEILFKSPIKDMLPMRNVTYNELSRRQIGYEPECNSMVIFRSYLEHMVTPHDSEKPRVTAAYNLS